MSLIFLVETCCEDSLCHEIF